MECGQRERAILAAKVYYRSTDGSVDAVACGTSGPRIWVCWSLKVIATSFHPNGAHRTYLGRHAERPLPGKSPSRYGVIGVHITPARGAWPPPISGSIRSMRNAWSSDVPVRLCGDAGPLWPMIPKRSNRLGRSGSRFPRLKDNCTPHGDPWKTLSSDWLQGIGTTTSAPQRGTPAHIPSSL